MAARAVLVVGGGADLDGRRVAAVRVLGSPVLAQLAQPGGVHGLRRHVAMRPGQRGAGRCSAAAASGTPALRSAAPARSHARRAQRPHVESELVMSVSVHVKVETWTRCANAMPRRGCCRREHKLRDLLRRRGILCGSQPACDRERRDCPVCQKRDTAADHTMYCEPDRPARTRSRGDNQWLNPTARWPRRRKTWSTPAVLPVPRQPAAPSSSSNRTSAAPRSGLTRVERPDFEPHDAQRPRRGARAQPAPVHACGAGDGDAVRADRQHRKHDRADRRAGHHPALGRRRRVPRSAPTRSR